MLTLTRKDELRLDFFKLAHGGIELLARLAALVHMVIELDIPLAPTANENISEARIAVKDLRREFALRALNIEPDAIQIHHLHFPLAQ
jgi:hypothetical protein